MLHSSLDGRFQWRFVLASVQRVLMPLWFLGFAYGNAAFIVQAGYLGGDFRIYFRATKAWLSGGDPWAAGVSYFTPAHFGAPPASMFPVVPFTLVSEDQAAVLSVVICALAGAYIVRRLRLGPSWLFFPPLVMGVVCGNPSVPLLALLLAGSSWAAALAVSLKIYAIVPLLAQRRWRAVFAAAALLTAMVVVAPDVWIDYVRRFGEISSRLSSESEGGYGALFWPPLLLPTALAMVVIARYDLRAAGWLVVPALWPGSEWHWTTFAMPVMTPWLAVLLAVNFRGVIAVATWPYAMLLWRRARRMNSARASAASDGSGAVRETRLDLAP
jgi:hypothetical protein